MKILEVITRSESGGGQTVVASLAGAFSALGHEVLIASGPEGGGEAWRGLDARVATTRVDGLQRSISPSREIQAIRSLSRLYRSFKPDIVHLHTSKAGAIGRLATGIDRRRIIYTMHGYDQLRIANRAFLAVDRALRRRCGAVVAVSSIDLAAMRADGYDATLIRNGVADARSLPDGDPFKIRRLEALRSEGRAIALMIARDARPKRIDLAREAAARLRGESSIAWIGGDPQPGDPPGFVALGEDPKAAAYLRNADIFLLLSDHEGMPISLLEAMSTGIPSIASAVGGCLEALGLSGPGQGPAGITVPNDAASVAETLRRLAAAPGLRWQIGKTARESWGRTYSVDAMAQGYLALFEARIFEAKRNRI